MSHEADSGDGLGNRLKKSLLGDLVRLPQMVMIMMMVILVTMVLMMHSAVAETSVWEPSRPELTSKVCHLPLCATLSLSRLSY